MLKKVHIIRLAALAVTLVAVLIVVTLSLRSPVPFRPVVIPTQLQLPAFPESSPAQVVDVLTNVPESARLDTFPDTFSNSRTDSLLATTATPDAQLVPTRLLRATQVTVVLPGVVSAEANPPTSTAGVSILVTAPVFPTLPLVLPTVQPFPTLVLPVAAPIDLPIDMPLPQAPVPNQLVITFKPDTSAAERQRYIDSLGGKVIQTIDALNTVTIELSGQQSSFSLSGSNLVTASEPDHYVSALMAVPPSDPYYSNQWALPVVGAPDAWLALPADAPQVVVAVIDSGICADHPDLQGRTLPGWDFVQNDAQPQDDFGHGCGVAGIIAANGDNGIGIAGVAPNALVMPLRVLNAQGLGTYSNVAAAIVFAADHDAQVINLSLGGIAQSGVLEQAVNYAVGKGVTVIAAAGNSGSAQLLYPAAYEQVIAVGSVDSNLQVSSFSNGGTNVDLLAPGRDILSLKADGGYGIMTGTSFAAPQVAGVAALELALGTSLRVDGHVVSAVDNLIGLPTDSSPQTLPAPTSIPVQDDGAGVLATCPNPDDTGLVRVDKELIQTFRAKRWRRLISAKARW